MIPVHNMALIHILNTQNASGNSRNKTVYYSQLWHCDCLSWGRKVTFCLSVLSTSSTILPQFIQHANQANHLIITTTGTDALYGGMRFTPAWGWGRGHSVNVGLQW